MTEGRSYKTEVLEGRLEAIERNRRDPVRGIMNAAAGGSGLGLVAGSMVGMVGGFAVGGIQMAGRVTPRAAGLSALLGGAYSAYDWSATLASRMEHESTAGSADQALSGAGGTPPAGIQEQLARLRDREKETGMALDAEKAALKQQMRQATKGTSGM
jgi:hypothetical protein